MDFVDNNLPTNKTADTGGSLINSVKHLKNI